MPVHLAARMHAFVHGMFRPTDEAETRVQSDKQDVSPASIRMRTLGWGIEGRA